MIQQPSLKLSLYFLIKFIELEGKELLFELNKGKLLNLIIHLFPHVLNVDSELKLPPILQPHQYFHVVLVVDVFLQLLNLRKREWLSVEFGVYDVELVVSHDQSHLLVPTVRHFARDALCLIQHYGLSIYDLALVQPYLPERWVFLHSLVPIYSPTNTCCPSSTQLVIKSRFSIIAAQVLVFMLSRN